MVRRTAGQPSYDCGRAALVDAMLACYAATSTLAAKRGVLGLRVKVSVFGFGCEARVIEREMQATRLFALKCTINDQTRDED